MKQANETIEKLTRENGVLKKQNADLTEQLDQQVSKPVAGHDIKKLEAMVKESKADIAFVTSDGKGLFEKTKFHLAVEHCKKNPGVVVLEVTENGLKKRA